MDFEFEFEFQNDAMFNEYGGDTNLRHLTDRLVSGPRINSPLMRKTMEVIEEDPRVWYQGDWRLPIAFVDEDGDVRDLSPVEVKTILDQGDRCDTAMCFAGWAAQLDGGVWLTDGAASLTARAGAVKRNLWDVLIPVPEDDKDDINEYAYALHDGDDYQPSYNDDPENYTFPGVRADPRAQRVLGLTSFESDVLFNGSNDIDNLRMVVADLLALAERQDVLEAEGVRV